jgi:hypothetical protein
MAEIVIVIKADITPDRRGPRCKERHMYLLLGHPDDPCCAGVFARLKTRGLPVRIFPAPLAPPARLTWRLDAAGLASSLDPESAITAVLVRDTAWVEPEGWDAAD